MFTIPPRIQGENNQRYSYRVIKDAIMYLELKPGRSISEVEIAEKLHISRTPVREVLTKLREEHLIEVIPQVGTNVSKINLQLIEEAAFMRSTIEKEILKLACMNFPESKLIELKRHLALQEELLGKREMERHFHALDKEFHLMIFLGMQKENVWAAITRLSTHYNRIRLLSEMENSFDEAIFQHREIIEMIERKQVEKVDAIVQEHILDPMKEWDRLYKQDSPYEQYFDRIATNRHDS